MTSRRPLLYLFAPTVLLLGALGWGQSTPPGDARLLRLAERLIGTWGEPGRTRVELLPGALPEGLPLDVPVPPQSILLGSLAHYEGGELSNAQIILDASMSTDEVIRFYDVRLRQQGWTGRPESKPSGFLPPQASFSAMYCAPGDKTFLYLSSLYTRNRTTDVRLNIYTPAEALYGPCPIAELPAQAIQGQAPLLDLNAPRGSDVFPQGSSQLLDQASSSALIRSESGPAAVAAHYEAQFASAGWEPTGRTASEGVIYSSWLLQTEEGPSWTAVLTFTALPGGTGRYAANLMVVPEMPDRAASVPPGG